MTPLKEMTAEQVKLWDAAYGPDYAPMIGCGLVDRFRYDSTWFRIGDVIDVGDPCFRLTARILSAGSIVVLPDACFGRISRRSIIVQVLPTGGTVFSAGDEVSISLWGDNTGHIRLNTLMTLAEI